MDNDHAFQRDLANGELTQKEELIARLAAREHDTAEMTVELDALRARLSQAEADRDVLAAEVRAWRVYDRRDTESNGCVVRDSISATDAAGALERAGL